MLGPFVTASRFTLPFTRCRYTPPAHRCLLSTTTTTTRDRGDRYGPMEWAQQLQAHWKQQKWNSDNSDCNRNRQTNWNSAGLLYLWTMQGTSTGGLQNPSLAMGPSVASGDFSHYWVCEDVLYHSTGASFIASSPFNSSSRY